MNMSSSYSVDESYFFILVWESRMTEREPAESAGMSQSLRRPCPYFILQAHIPSPTPYS